MNVGPDQPEVQLQQPRPIVFTYRPPSPMFFRQNVNNQGGVNFIKSDDNFNEMFERNRQRMEKTREKMEKDGRKFTFFPIFFMFIAIILFVRIVLPFMRKFLHRIIALISNQGGY